MKLRFYLIEWEDTNDDFHQAVVCARNTDDAERIWEFRQPDGAINHETTYNVTCLPSRRGFMYSLS